MGNLEFDFHKVFGVKIDNPITVYKQCRNHLIPQRTSRVLAFVEIGFCSPWHKTREKPVHENGRWSSCRQSTETVACCKKAKAGLQPWECGDGVPPKGSRGRHVRERLPIPVGMQDCQRHVAAQILHLETNPQICLQAESASRRTTTVPRQASLTVLRGNSKRPGHSACVRVSREPFQWLQLQQNTFGVNP